MTLYAPTLDELKAAGRPYAHIAAIRGALEREQEARRALVALVPASHRLEAEHLVNIIEQAGRRDSEAWAEDQLRTVARHFPFLETAMLAIYSHVQESAGGADQCSCPAGKAATEEEQS